MLSDFYNWNIVDIRYCDGGSFAGDAEGEDRVSDYSDSCDLGYLLRLPIFTLPQLIV